MIRSLLHHSSPEARRLLIAELVFIVATAILQGIAFLLLVPLLRALFLGDSDAAGSWLIAIAVVGAGYALTTWFASQIGMKASSALLDSLLTGLGDRVVELPVAWFGADRSGLIAGIATQGAMFVSNMPYAILRQVLTGFITPGTVLVGMYVFDWRLALAMTVMVPVLMIGYRTLSRVIGRGDAIHAETVAEASTRVIEFARAQPTLRTAGEGSIADRLVADALHEQHRAYRGMLATGGVGIATFAGLVQLSLTLLLVVGAWLAIGGTVDVATLIALLVLGVRFNEPIVSAGDLGGGVAVARNTLDQLDQLAAVQALPEPETPATPSDWSIEFRDVMFGYGGAPVLRDLSFTAPAGGMTAIVGPSGSGKTTITKLVARFYDPEEGTQACGAREACQRRQHHRLQRPAARPLEHACEREEPEVRREHGQQRTQREERDGDKPGGPQPEAHTGPTTDRYRHPGGHEVDGRHPLRCVDSGAKLGGHIGHGHAYDGRAEQRQYAAGNQHGGGGGERWSRKNERVSFSS